MKFTLNRLDVPDAALITATHEAGHVVAVRHASLFDFHDEAIRRTPTLDANALAGARRPRVPATPEEAEESVRQFFKIAVSGRAAEIILEEESAALGKRIVPDPEGSRADMKRAFSTLADQGMSHLKQVLMEDAGRLLEDHWDEVEAVVDLFLTSDADVITKAQVDELFATRFP